MAELVLRADKLIETIVRLNHRIEARFPKSGLLGLCEQLLRVAQLASQRSEWIGRPVAWIRISSLLIAVLLAILFVGAILAIIFRLKSLDLPELMQVLDTGTNEAVLFGAVLFFLLNLENRIKRGRALIAIHELRSIAHIIDMHQLTKDPERLLRGWKATDSSPKQQMTPFELNRYLDYCSEMLSLTGKIAALYVQRFDDAVALESVSEVETLCNDLSRKIWQKIMVIERLPSEQNIALPQEKSSIQEGAPGSDAVGS